MKNVQTAFPVTKFDDMTENRDHQPARLFPLVNLIGDQPDEFFLFFKEHQRIDHAAAHDTGIERTVDKIRNAKFIRPFDTGRRCFGGDHYDGNLFDPLILIHQSKHFESVHFRHHDVQKDQIDLVFALFEDFYRLFPVFGFEDFEFSSQHIGKQRTVNFGIVGDQYFLFSL